MTEQPNTDRPEWIELTRPRHPWPTGYVLRVHRWSSRWYSPVVLDALGNEVYIDWWRAASGPVGTPEPPSDPDWLGDLRAWIVDPATVWAHKVTVARLLSELDEARERTGVPIREQIAEAIRAWERDGDLGDVNGAADAVLALFSQPPPPKPQRRIWVRLTDEGARGRKAWSSGQQVYVHEWTDYGPRVTDPEAVTVDTVVLLPGEYVSGASAADPEPQRPEWVRLTTDGEDIAGWPAGTTLKPRRWEALTGKPVVACGPSWLVADDEIAVHQKWWVPADPPPPEPEPPEWIELPNATNHLPAGLHRPIKWVHNGTTPVVEDADGGWNHLPPSIWRAADPVPTPAPPPDQPVDIGAYVENWRHMHGLLKPPAADPPVVPAPQTVIANPSEDRCICGHIRYWHVRTNGPCYAEPGGVRCQCSAFAAAASPTVREALNTPPCTADATLCGGTPTDCWNHAATDGRCGGCS